MHDPTDSDTFLVVRLPAGDDVTDHWPEVVRLADGLPVPAPKPGVVAAGFPGVWGAAHAAVQLVPPGSAARAALCGAGEPARPVGETLERAIRLLEATGPGQILTTAATAILAGLALPSDTHLIDHGPGPDDERVYEIRPSAAARRPPSNLDWARRAAPEARSATPPATLARQWQAALGGRPQLLLLGSGPAGTATRAAVAAEFALRCHAEGALVLYGRWDPDTPVPVQAFREALGRYADGSRTADLRAEWGDRIDEIGQLLPEVAARIGQPGPARSGWTGAGRLPEAIESWLIQLSGRRPTLLVLDDAQWADELSLQILGHLWHVWRHGALMVLITALAPIGSPGLAALIESAEHGGDGAFTTVTLS